MKRIELSQGKFAIVDDEDYDYISQFRWHCNLINGKYYAGRYYKTEDGYKIISMHRFILEPEKGVFIDHINGDGLDNRRCNLRLCTMAQNNCNRSININNTSGYKGVVYNKKANKWQAQIKYKKKIIYIGLFYIIEEAAKAYNKAALKYHGDFAKLNEIKEKKDKQLYFEFNTN